VNKAFPLPSRQHIKGKAKSMRPANGHILGYAIDHV
jgi:hypothetical protein